MFQKGVVFLIYIYSLSSYDTDLLITGYSSGILSFHYFCKGNVESDIFTSLNVSVRWDIFFTRIYFKPLLDKLQESIQAIYTLHLKQGEENNLGSSLLRPKPKLSTVHNTLLIVGWVSYSIKLSFFCFFKKKKKII